MYYFPGFIFSMYTYIAVKKSDLADNESPPMYVINNVFTNLMLTEFVFLLGWLYDPLTVESLSFVRLILFYLAQDVYFYCVHKFIFHGPLWYLHRTHHAYITSHAAWYQHHIEHIVLNIGSVVVPFWLFSNPPWVFFMIICQQIYTSVNGHTKTSPHSIHHNNMSRRFGSIYLIDRIMDSF